MADVARGAHTFVDLSIFENWGVKKLIVNISDEDAKFDSGKAAVTSEPDSEQAPSSDEPGAAAAGEDGEEPNLTKYEPPEALRRLPNVNSETIIAVVRGSIENVRAQVAAEEEQRQQQRQRERERELREREEAARREQEVKPETANVPTQGAEESAVAAVQPTDLAAEATPSSAVENMPSTKPLAKRGFIFRHIFRRKVLFGLQETAGHAHGTSASGEDRSAAEGRKDALKQAIQRQEEQVECISCFDEFSPKQVIKTTCHSYCKDCFQRLIANAVENEAQWPPKCCLNPIAHRTILKHVPADLRRRYEKCAEEFSVPVDERVYCAAPGCGVFIRKSGLRPEERRARCPAGHWTCTACRQPAHPDAAACPRNEDLRRVQRLARREGWQRCHRCGNLVEHAEACQHMTCRCGAEFCYVCGARWRTCQCTAEQLSAIKARAARRARRRASVQEREIREQRELNEALRLVEEAEREEARRREEARQEAERLRREEVAARYADLREKLAELNDLQNTLLGYQHDRERDLLAARAREAGEGIAKKQAAKRAELEVARVERLAEGEREWAREYRLRLALERRLEDDYRAKLEAYRGAGRPGESGREERAARALRAFMRKNDERYEAWRRRRDGDAERLRWALDDEAAVQGELMGARAARLAESFDAQEAEMGSRQRAENRWFELVTAERGRMLNELEGVEMEVGGGEDTEAEDWYSIPAEDEHQQPGPSSPVQT